MAAMLMVQDEGKTEGDEFRKEPEPEEVCEAPLYQNTIRWRSYAGEGCSRSGT